METIQHIAEHGYQTLCSLIDSMSLKQKTFETGEYILQQGEPITCLYWITLGEYTMHYSAENGKTFSLGQRFVSNCIIGELEYLTHTPSQFSVVANERMDVKVIPLTVMNQILSTHAEVGVWLRSPTIDKHYLLVHTLAAFIHHFIYYLYLCFSFPSLFLTVLFFFFFFFL